MLLETYRRATSLAVVAVSPAPFDNWIYLIRAEYCTMWKMRFFVLFLLSLSLLAMMWKMPSSCFVTLLSLWWHFFSVLNYYYYYYIFTHIFKIINIKIYSYKKLIFFNIFMLLIDRVVIFFFFKQDLPSFICIVDDKLKIFISLFESLGPIYLFDLRSTQKHKEETYRSFFVLFL